MRIRERKQTIVAAIGLRALATTDLNQLLVEATEMIRQTLRITYVSVFEFRPESASFYLRAGAGWHEGVVGRASIESNLHTPAGQVLTSKKPLVVDDLRTDPRFELPPLLRKHRVVSSAIVTITGQERPFGVLEVDDVRHRAFRRDDVNFLQMIANVLAAAIERKRADDDRLALVAHENDVRVLAEANQRRVRSLYNATRQMTESLDLAPVFQMILAAAQQLLGTDRVVVLQPNDQGSWESQASVGLPPEYLAMICTHGEHLPLLRLVTEKRGPVGVTDIATMTSDTIFAELVQRHGIRSALAAPLVRRGVVNGILIVYHNQPRAYTSVDLETAEVLASHAAIAIDNASLYQAAQDRANEVSVLYEATKQIMESPHPTTTLTNVLDSIVRLTGCDLATVAMVEPAGTTVRFDMTRRPTDIDHTLIRVPVTEGITGIAARTGETINVPDFRDDPRRNEELADMSGARSGLFVPLRTQDRVIGVLVVLSQQLGYFTPNRERMLLGLADRVALAIENARLYREAHDALDQLRRTQQQVIQQQRLHALGQMASGIAHDFNNALAGVIGYTELLLNVYPERMHEPETVRSYLELINTAATDAAGVVKRLRDFYRSHDGADVLAEVDLNTIVRQVVSLTRPRWRDQAQAEGVAINLEVDLGEIQPVIGNEPDLRGALTNLVLNAVDALPTGGTVAIQTRQGGDRVTVTISDNGIGMTEEIRRRCFEPFFTTKGQRGSGIGLAMVYGIVNRHRGTIDVQSDVGVGTQVRISLPLESVPADRVRSVPLATERVRGRRILVVDDEAPVLEVIRGYLAADGHHIETATNGQDGLDLFEHGQFDLVVTDHAMPGFNGDQLAAAIKQRSPHTPVILLTGFGEMVTAFGGHPTAVDLIVSKPVRWDGLRLAMQTVLAAT